MKHASENGFKTVIVVSEDTDVFILCAAFAKKINASIFQKKGTKNRVQYININRVVETLGDSLAQTLIGFHAFTGCDSVIAFAGRGKSSHFKQLKKKTRYS